MTLTLTYTNGDTVVLTCVQFVRLVEASVIEVQCFGNEPVLHRTVAKLDVVYVNEHTPTPLPPTYVLSWCAEDVQTMRPDLTTAEADAFLCRNWKYIQDRLCELGWGVIETNLAMDDQLPPEPPPQ
jgi:hypothetical protein